jgi:acyl dehydratase
MTATQPSTPEPAARAEGTGARRAATSAGDSLPETSHSFDRAGLVRYAGASGDFNPIHWNQEFAESVGLPGVIGHGMLSMAVAARAVSDFAGDPTAIKRFRVRFSAMIQPGETLTISGEVVSAENGTVRVAFSGANDAGERVLSKGEAVLELP